MADNPNTNTAAREVANVLVRADHIERMELVGRQCIDGAKCHHGCLKSCSRRTSCVPLSIADSYLRDDWTLIATQQQGGEQEARDILADALNATSDYVDGMKPDAYVSKAVAFKAIQKALRTKQPAASEGDGRTCDFQTAVALEVGADEENQGDIIRHVRAWVASAKGQSVLSNTNKQAAGEAVAADECGRPLTYWGGKAPPRHPADEGRAVTDEMVTLALAAYYGPADWTSQLNRDSMKLALTAALQAGTP